LLRRELLQLVPRRDPQTSVLTRELLAERWRQPNAVAGRCGALALLALVLLRALQRSARIQHPAEQALLSLDQLPVEPTRVEPAGQLLGLVGQLSGAGHVALALHPLELLGQGPLALGQ